MKTLYFDESGDLGFSHGSSTYFVVGFLTLPENQDKFLRRAIRDVKRWANIPREAELKAYNSDDPIRFRVLKRIAEFDSEIYTVSLFKPKVFDRLRTDTNILYNYATRWLLVPYFEEVGLLEARIIADLRITKQSSGMRFDDYIKAELWAESGIQTRLDFQHLDSAHCLGLQAVDFVTHALYRGREAKDWRFWNVIRHRSKRAKRLFFDDTTKKPTLDEGGL